jgi:hypothetical protein
MVHVLDDLRAAGWRPPPELVPPPPTPDRDSTEP